MPYIISSEKLLSDPDLQEIFKIVASLKDQKEIEKVLSDILSDYELEKMLKRWQLIKMVAQKVPYRKIAEKLGISTATVNRGAYSLYQKRGGWQLLLGRLERSE